MLLSGSPAFNVNIRTWNISAGVEQHVMNDTGVVNNGRRTNDVIGSVIWQVEALADVRRLVCRHRCHRETQRYIQHACSEQHSNNFNIA